MMVGSLPRPRYIVSGDRENSAVGEADDQSSVLVDGGFRNDGSVEVGERSRRTPTLRVIASGTGAVLDAEPLRDSEMQPLLDGEPERKVDLELRHDSVSDRK
jgi:hypothetical protein